MYVMYVRVQVAWGMKRVLSGGERKKKEEKTAESGEQFRRLTLALTLL
jgi:hypothetical protein